MGDPMTDSAAASSVTRERLDRAFLHGLAWSAVGRWLSQVFRWVATILTARLLLPVDYGIVGIAMMIVGLLQYVAEFGFGAAIVQQRSLSQTTVRQIGGASVIIAMALSLLMVASTPLITNFYKQPALTLVLPVMSLRFLIDAFAVVPRSVLARDLEFRKLSILEGVESVVMAALTVGTAWLTRSYWSFVVGNLVSGLVFTLAAVGITGLGPSVPRALSEIRSQMAFGYNVVVSRVAWYAYMNADFAIVGRILSAAVLGLYTFAWSIASVPAEKLSGLVLRVAPSILSASRSDPGEMRRYYLLLVRGVALVTFPVAVGLALVSHDLVQGLFGAKWDGAIIALQLLAMFFGVRSIATLAPVVMIACGEPRVDRNYSLTFLLVLPPLFLLGSRWGITGVAATWLIAYPALFSLLGQRWVLNRLGIPFRQFLAEMWPALSGVGLMALSVLLTGYVFDGRGPVVVRLLLTSIIGAATYVVALRTLHRRVFEAAVQLVRNRTAVPVS